MNPEPRDIALELLYEADQRQVEPDLTGVTSKIQRIVSGVMDNQDWLDEAIGSASDHWKLDRMPPVDRAILRIGLYELRFEPSVPVAVIVSEAVRLAQIYSTERSGAFVNGVLGFLATEVRP